LRLSQRQNLGNKKTSFFIKAKSIFFYRCVPKEHMFRFGGKKIQGSAVLYEKWNEAPKR